MNSMVEVLADLAYKQPDILFVVDSSGDKYTYNEAWAIVLTIANNLVRNYDIVNGDKIMVECHQDAAFLLVDFACELIGAVFIPIEDNASYDRKKTIFEETEAKLWVTNNVTLDFMQSVLKRHLLERNGMYEGYVFPDENTVAQILYTTGTTGKSKGIVITNAANVAVAENIKLGVNMKPYNIEFIPIPISHSHGLRCCYANLINGGTIILMDGLMNIKRVFQMIDEYHVSAMDVSPSAVQLLIKVSKGKFWEYGRKLDYIQIGTAALPEFVKEQLIEELPGVRLYNFYGSTESGRSCVLDFSAVKGKENCIGKETKNASIIFTDDNRSKIDATENCPGLLASSGRMNMLGYWNNQNLTNEIMQDGYVFTNDLGYKDSDGYIYVIGRKDDVINYNGIKIAPEEIEQVAIKYHGVEDVACVPMPDKMAGQVPRLFISVDSVDDFDMKQYIEYLAEYLDGNKMPKKVEIISEIPRTSNGKIKRKDLIQ